MLELIVAEKKKRVAAAKSRLPVKELKQRCKEAGTIRPFHEALLRSGITVIAEVKKASPSCGDFRLAVSPGELALRYQAGGAGAVSVLTEEDFFKGSNEDLSAVRAAVALPVLRKDFVLDDYQLYESRLLCADAVLLIASLLSASRLREYLSICTELGLAALVEVHRGDEVEPALRSGAKILGINNRNLRTFKTDLEVTVNLAKMVPEGVILVSESGIRTREDVAKLEAAGAKAILVGETLLGAKDPAAMIAQLKGTQ